MSIKFPPPPKNPLDLNEWALWYETLWQRVRGLVVTTGDAAATIGSGETYHGVTALTDARTLTLPPANDLQDGDELIIQDESGAAGTYTITIARAGSDTINGATSVTITSNYGRRRLIKRGSGKWFSA